MKAEDGCLAYEPTVDVDSGSIAGMNTQDAYDFFIKAEVIYYPIGHFDIYVGENFEKAVSDQLDFFKKYL